MIKRTLVGTGLVSLVATVACSSSMTPSDPPLRTSDRAVVESHPGYYDTTLMGAPDANGHRSVAWQHTTPEQYAYEVAVRTGKIPADHLVRGSNGTTVEYMQEDTSSGCDNYPGDVWFYNYDDGANCSAPYNNNVRACVQNTDPNNGATIALGGTYGIAQYRICSGYTCWWVSWTNNVRMYWPGSESGYWLRSAYSTYENFSDYNTQSCTTAGTTAQHADYLGLN